MKTFIHTVKCSCGFYNKIYYTNTDQLVNKVIKCGGCKEVVKI